MGDNIWHQAESKKEELKLSWIKLRGAAPPASCWKSYPTAWPPTASPLGNIWWQARGFPGLPDGIYTYVALRNRGVDGDAPAPKGQLRAAKTTDTVVKHLRETGVPEGVIVFE